MKDFILVIFVSLLMFGCAGTDPGVITVVTKTTGEIVTTISGAITQRDYMYTQQHINRDKMTKAMYMKSGVTLKMKEYKLSDGSVAFLPEEMSIRGEPHFQQTLETRPPDHRVWDTVDKGIDLLTFGVGAYFLSDFGKHAVDAAAPTYYGDYNMNSLNQTAAPYYPPEYIVNPTPPLMR